MTTGQPPRYASSVEPAGTWMGRVAITGGRESSFVYHWAKRSALPLLVLSWVIYLALPFSLHPTFVILPFATLFALSVSVTASSFKKYL